MDLIDRYLAAVRRHLSRPQQEQTDIVAELSDILRSEAEDTEHTLGHPLTEQDQAELLKRHGHPWIVASRYLPQQYLIGPSLYPYYRRTLSVLLFWVVLPLSIVFGAIAAVNAQSLATLWDKSLHNAWDGCIYAVGIATITFAVLELNQVRFTGPTKWRPESLPESTGGPAASRGEALFSMLFSITFVLWWAGLVELPALDTHAEALLDFAPAPIWARMYLPILACSIAGIGLAWADLVRPWRTRLVSTLHAMADAATFVVAMVLLRAGHWVEVTGTRPELPEIDYWINWGIGASLAIAAVVVAFEALREVRRVINARRGLAV